MTYYNYVDLNGDGSNEIFAVAVGPYTSGSGGDSGMWLIPYAGMTVSQSFTLIRTPIIVSDTTTNGAHEPILQRSGGGAETEYVRLVCSDGVYSNPADAEVVEDLAAVTGKAIISNDLTVDMQSGDYLTLADAAKADSSKSTARRNFDKADTKFIADGDAAGLPVQFCVCGRKK